MRVYCIANEGACAANPGSNREHQSPSLPRVPSKAHDCEYSTVSADVLQFSQFAPVAERQSVAVF